jgi:hypothetical protein
MTTKTDLDHRPYWERGIPFEQYLEEGVEENENLWKGVYRKVRVPGWALERAEEIGGRWRLLVITEDWCGDASNTVPVLARFASEADGVELRVVERDQNTELMDRYLTNGGRAIPVAVLLDGDFEPHGHWGPRPEELQQFVLREKEKGEMETDELYRETRRWYARDGGETTLRELLDLMEDAATDR